MANKKIQKRINKTSMLKTVFIMLLCVSAISYVIYYFSNQSDAMKHKVIILKDENTTKTTEKIEKKTNAKSIVYLFYLPTCGYCHRAMSFIETNLKDKYKNIDFKYINVSLNDGRKLYFKIKNKLNIVSNGVPVTVIGEKYFLGFGDNTGDEYIKAIEAEILSKKSK